MTQKITGDCFRNEDEDGYLAECEHQEHALEHCFIAGCGGFIVNWETWEAPDNFICEICQDCGYHYDESGELVQP